MKDIKIKKIDNKEAPMKLLFLADPSKESIKKYLKNGNCFVAFEKDMVIGAYILINPKKEISEIANIAVDKNMQNKGIGKLLVKDAIKRAKKEGIKKVISWHWKLQYYSVIFLSEMRFQDFSNQERLLC